MKIYIDADACPNVIKEIIFRASERLKIETILVANKPINTPRSKLIKLIQVPAGFDVADAKIVEIIEPSDLVITADIPLASLVINKRAHALNPRGELYTSENIRERLAVRNLMEGLRAAGQITGGPAAMNKTDQQNFANALDRFLARHR
ncbi:MAG: YaiI/YqxD family protein [Gammaproteobacteria bacterium]